jgi:hypothetical protein
MLCCGICHKYPSSAMTHKIGRTMMDRSTSKHLGKVVEVVVKQKQLIPVKLVCTTGKHMATGN